MPCITELEVLVYLAFLDDSGTHPDKKTKFQIMTGVVLEGWEFRDIELVMGLLIEELVLIDKQDEFKEFHAWELFQGCGPFEGVDENRRTAAVEGILYTVEARKVPIVCGAVNLDKLAEKMYSSANPLDICFRLCIQGIESWAAQHIVLPRSTKSEELQDAQPLVVLICDDFQQKIKEPIKESFRNLRGKVRPPNYDSGKTKFLHDGLYFGSSKDLIGIQIADLCAYIIRRHLEGDPVFSKFYSIIEGCICSLQVGPSDDVVEFKDHANAKDKASQ